MSQSGKIIIYLGKTWWLAVELITFSIAKRGRKKNMNSRLFSIFCAEIQNISVQLFCLKMQSKNIALSTSHVINIHPYKGETEIPIFLSLFLNLRASGYLEEDKC